MVFFTVGSYWPHGTVNVTWHQSRVKLVIWGSHSGLGENSMFLACDAVYVDKSSGEHLPIDTASQLTLTTFLNTPTPYTFRRLHPRKHCICWADVLYVILEVVRWTCVRTKFDGKSSSRSNNYDIPRRIHQFSPPTRLWSELYCVSPLHTVRLWSELYCVSPLHTVLLWSELYCVSPLHTVRLWSELYCVSPFHTVRLWSELYCVSPLHTVQLWSELYCVSPLHNCCSVLSRRQRANQFR